MTLKVVDADKSQTPGPGQGRGTADSNEKGTYESRTRRDRDQLGLSPIEGLTQQEGQGLEVFSGGQFGNHATVGRMSRNLRGETMEQDLSFRAEQGNRTLVAGCLNTESDQHLQRRRSAQCRPNGDFELPNIRIIGVNRHHGILDTRLGILLDADGNRVAFSLFDGRGLHFE